MIILISIFAGCILLAFLNYRFFKLYPDKESREGEQETEYHNQFNEYGNPPYESKDPYKVKHPISWQVNYLIDWIILLVVSAGIVWGIIELFFN